jgi:hypothetical protein
MPIGRPTVLTKPNIRLIAEAFLYGLSDAEVALLTDVNVRTIERARAGGFCREIKRAEVARKMLYIRRITEGKRADWARWAWFLERRFPKEFSKPEVQLAVQNNYNVGALQINITSGEVKQIEAVAEPVRAKVKEMFATYKPAQLGNGNGNAKYECAKNADN